MDYAACNVVYVDRTAREDRLVKRDDATSAREDKGPGTADDYYYALVSNGPSPLDENLQVLLETFSEGRSHDQSPSAILTFSSSCLYIGQILRIETIRIEPILNC